MRVCVRVCVYDVVISTGVCCMCVCVYCTCHGNLIGKIGCGHALSAYAVLDMYVHIYTRMCAFTYASLNVCVD